MGVNYLAKVTLKIRASRIPCLPLAQAGNFLSWPAEGIIRSNQDRILVYLLFEAIEDKDLDKLAEYYAQDDNVTAFLPTGPFRLDGYQRIWGEIERYKDKPTVNRIQTFQPQVQIYGDVAVATFYSTTSLRSKGVLRTACAR